MEEMRRTDSAVRTDREGTRDMRTLPDSGKAKRGPVSRILAAVLMAAMIATAAFGAGDPGSPAAENAQTAAQAPAAAVRKTGYAPAMLSRTAKRKPALSGRSIGEEKEELFRDGDYTGQVDAKGKDSDGIELPKAGEGERLYIGYADLPNVGLTKAALLLSADGKSVHDITVFLKDIDSRLENGALSGITSIQTKNTQEYELPVKDEPLGESTLLEITAEDGLIFVRMDYSFRFYGLRGNDSRTIHLGEMEFWMKQAG
ncbi:MAG: hypothetical protein IKN76_01155 [Oscillospiraceae bacterium]|nr:hypothetical protein [Oscillospiraceae bacterium]